MLYLLATLAQEDIGQLEAAVVAASTITADNEVVTIKVPTSVLTALLERVNIPTGG